MIDLPELEMTNIYPIEDRYKIDKDVSGVYFFYDSEFDLMYVGKSTDVRKRISSHLSKGTNTQNISHNFKYFNYVEISDIVDMDIYETWYINTMQPKLNIEKVLNYTSMHFDAKYNTTYKQRAEHKADVQARLDIRLESHLLLV